MGGEGLDEEARRIVERIVRSMAGRGGVGDRGSPCSETVGVGSEPGVYRYDRARGCWVPVGGLGNDGVHVVYFGNRRCPACRVFDIYWNLLVQFSRGNVVYEAVLCDWFEEDCRSPVARRLFREFGVTSTPMIVLMELRGGRRVRERRLRGVSDLRELATAVDGFSGE